MSTKNLSRTVIEGGRDRYNKFQRRHSNAVERTHAHRLERALCRTQEPDEALFVPRQPHYRVFYDKLGPARRWLVSQAGRPWDKVRSELFARFDARTTPGRHILFDHLLDEVEAHDLSWRYARFGISRHGILEHYGRKRWPFGGRPPLPEPEPTLRAWLGARRVIEHGPRLYWLVPTLHGGFRQQHELAPEDAARFKALPHWFREPFTGPPPRAESARS